MQALLDLLYAVDGSVADAAKKLGISTGALSRLILSDDSVRLAVNELRASKGELQYFIGVQLDASDHVEPLRNRLSEQTELKSAKLVKATAENVNEAIRELPDANLRPEDLWAVHSQPVFPKPRKRFSSCWTAIKKITATGEKLGLNHFKPIRPLGCGDTGRYMNW